MITALGGGVGAAKFLEGLSAVIGDEQLQVIVNTGDDIKLGGLNISP
ncbi:MAG: 2-phospho-L-lactate transferase CofD family protein, partial [Thermodesulfobacteriota bacterium]